jgi:WASH complex subunit 7
MCGVTPSSLRYIKSHLSRERRWYKQNKESKEVDGQYPHERASALLKDIKKLGVNEDGLTFVDQFRLLITEIGNALGFVRMVRSAGLHYVSNAIKFVPDITRIINFEKYAGSGGPKDEVDRLREKRVLNPLDDRLGGGGGGYDDENGGGNGEESEAAQRVEGVGLSAETVAAAKNLDSVLGNLSSNFASGTDFLKILVAAFRAGLSGPENAHLKNFYYFMPTLILNFVEKLRLGKRESLNMRVSHLKNNRSAYFTDDGFAIGLSYILAILQQNDDFDSLQWFRSVNAHFAQVAKDVTRLRAQAEQTEDTYQEVLNKTNRLADERREIEMFYFSFSGSRIFFTEDNADADDDEEEGEGGGAEGGGGGGEGGGGGGGGEAPPPPPPPPM